jgi:hypothetical protein
LHLFHAFDWTINPAKGKSFLSTSPVMASHP